MTRSYIVEQTDPAKRTYTLARLSSLQYAGFSMTPIFGAILVIIGSTDKSSSSSLWQYALPGIMVALLGLLCILLLLYVFKDIQNEINFTNSNIKSNNSNAHMSNEATYVNSFLKKNNNTSSNNTNNNNKFPTYASVEDGVVNPIHMNHLNHVSYTSTSDNQNNIDNNSSLLLVSSPLSTSSSISATSIEPFINSTTNTSNINTNITSANSTNNNNITINNSNIISSTVTTNNNSNNNNNDTFDINNNNTNNNNNNNNILSKLSHYFTNCCQPTNNDNLDSATLKDLQIVYILMMSLNFTTRGAIAVYETQSAQLLLGKLVGRWILRFSFIFEY